MLKKVINLLKPKEISMKIQSAQFFQSIYKVKYDVQKQLEMVNWRKFKYEFY